MTQVLALLFVVIFVVNRCQADAKILKARGQDGWWGSIACGVVLVLSVIYLYLD